MDLYIFAFYIIYEHTVGIIICVSLATVILTLIDSNFRKRLSTDFDLSYSENSGSACLQRHLVSFIWHYCLRAVHVIN